MTTATRFLTYSHTVGMCVMEGRGFLYPRDMALGHNGRIYVLNRSHEDEPRGVRVAVCDVDDGYYGDFGSQGTGDGQFNWPSAIAVDSRDNVYVASDYSHTISVFDSSGKFLERWGEQGGGRGQLDAPSGLAFDDDDSLYVADHRNHRVQRFTSDGRFLSSFGREGSGDGELDRPWGVTVAPSGDVYVADWRNDRIQRFSPEGEFRARYGRSGDGDGELNRPSDVAVDADGYMYVADWGNQRVQVLDPDGDFVMKLRGEATLSAWAEEFLRVNDDEAAGRAKADLEPDIYPADVDPHVESSNVEKLFWGVVSVRLDPQGRLYALETNRHRIQVYTRAR